jgi:two-component system cell cycle response regulator DivK
VGTILLVEDNVDNQAIYCAILEHSGHRVLQAFDGEHGIQMAREYAPDLIFMDVTMPRLNGLDATRILKADPGTSHIPVVVLTAHGMAADRERALAAGCDAYLSKPVEPKRVLEEANRILGIAD